MGSSGSQRCHWFGMPAGGCCQAPGGPLGHLILGVLSVAFSPDSSQLSLRSQSCPSKATSSSLFAAGISRKGANRCCLSNRPGL